MDQRFCPICGQPTVHANVAEAARLAHVSRTTLYAWIRRSLVHGVVQPSGRKLICVEALARPLEAVSDTAANGNGAAHGARASR
jgi:transposase-like protein